MAFHPLYDHSGRPHGRADTYPPLPPRRHEHAYGHAPYANSSDAQVSSAYGNAMMSREPAPYNAFYPHVYDERRQGRAMASQQLNYPSHDNYQSEHLPPDLRSYSSSSTIRPRTSSIDVSGKTKASSHGKEQDPERSANLLGRPIPSMFIDCPVVRSVNQSVALCDRVSVTVNHVLSRLDSEDFDYRDVVDRKKDASTKEKKIEDQARGLIDFKKTWLYSNSRLPPGLLPMKLYLPTWEIVCKAADASLNVYGKPRKGEQDFISADRRQGTKTMVVSCQPLDRQNLIVIAIRGSTWNLVDWSVNWTSTPTEPIGFLDDNGNACHSGFLQVARAMVDPIAARLRQFLEEDTSSAPRSLLLTGHSAGGAVASLLYMHMISVTIESNLNILTGCFKRIHCVSFGAPPCSFLPLQHPPRCKNIFLAFANEGDLVVRASKQYASTLGKIIAAPSPLASSSSGGNHGSQGLRQRMSRSTLNTAVRYKPVKWEVPPATLSNAGRIVLIRAKPNSPRAVEAVQVTDEQLRDVIFGDPSMHPMKLYKSRIDELAVAAVTGRPAG